MTRTIRTAGPSLAVIAFATLVGTGAMAQAATTDEEHSAHHPGSVQTAQAAPSPATPPAPPATAAPPQAMPGMMGGPGTMGGPGMMGGPDATGMPDESERRRMLMMRHGAAGAPMNVIINVGPGIRVDVEDEDGRGGRRRGMGMSPPGGPGMMGQMGRWGDPMGPDALRHFDRVDAHLAYVRAALRITEAQAPQWNAFSDAARVAAERLRQAYAQAMQAAAQPAAAPAQLERRAALLAARLEATRAVAAAMGSLYGTLSDEQKRIADELIAEHQDAMPMR